MNKTKKYLTSLFAVLLSTVIGITSCNLPSSRPSLSFAEPTSQVGEAVNNAFFPTPLPVRPAYNPGELVDYTAQTGDTLPALAARFNTTVDEILFANPQIPRDATTMPPGMPMQIPIYYRALWGSSFQIIPDHAFVNGPTHTGFNTAAFVASQPGWLKSYRAYVAGTWRSGAELVDYVSVNYSLSPRLLLAILEYQGGALTAAEPPVSRNLLGFSRTYWETPYLQLVIAANTLNNGYYGWRLGTLLEFEDTNRNLLRPDPWQNAASAALHFYYSRIFTGDAYAQAVSPQGFAQTYSTLFGDPWQETSVLIPGSLQQPELRLPFPSDQTWSFTGGPHTGWGSGEPFSAIDFAPPMEKAGCFPAKEENYAIAMADGLVVRSNPQEGVALDLDMDGNERTGWVIYYLHLATNSLAPLGSTLKVGDMIGYPSCEGGRSTGTHVHVARKYNGEWIAADSPIPFVLSGWTVRNGSREYLGTLTKGSAVVRACDCSDAFTAINGSYP